MKEILIYGPIGQATTAADVVRQFQEAEDEEVLLRIHSEGGSVLDGYAMLSAINRHKKKVYAQVEGMAFSMAAVIALALKDNLAMARDAWIMFHEVRNYAGGTEEDLERQLEQMRLMNQAIVSQLAEALSISEEEAAEQLKNEIWMNGQQAYDAGLVSKLLPETALAAYADPERHKNAPQEFFTPKETKTKQPTEMKLFKLFQNDKIEAPSLELAEIGPEDLGAELAEIQKSLDETVATHAAELVARDEKHAQAMQNALDEQRAELEAAHAEALSAAENSAEEKANAIVAQAGHEPVEVLPSETETREERVRAQYAAINIAERGGVEKRRAFRKEHKDIFGG